MSMDKLRTIIAGSRDFEDYSLLEKTIATLPWNISTVISGGARGADTLGALYAHDYSIPVETYPAQWGILGKSAGYIRNILMAEKAEALVAFWDGESKGTAHMIDIATTAKLRVHIVRTDKL